MPGASPTFAVSISISSPFFALYIATAIALSNLRNLYSQSRCCICCSATISPSISQLQLMYFSPRFRLRESIDATRRDVNKIKFKKVTLHFTLRSYQLFNLFTPNIIRNQGEKNNANEREKKVGKETERDKNRSFRTRVFVVKRRILYWEVKECDGNSVEGMYLGLKKPTHFHTLEHGALFSHTLLFVMMFPGRRITLQNKQRHV